MVREFRALVQAVSTIQGVKVIKTSYLSSKKDWPLPAIIVDYENPVFGSATEDGELYVKASRFSVIVHVKPNQVDPEIAMEALEDLWEQVLDTIGAAYSEFAISIDQPIIDMMPFGLTQEALGVGFYLTISDGD